MNKILSINISLQLKAMETKLCNFIFPEPVTPYLKKLMVQELFESLRVAAKTGKDSTFPSIDLVNMYGIEGPYQISFFCRALSEFQRNISALLVGHGILDELVHGNYSEAAIVKSRMVFSPKDSTGDVYLENLNEHNTSHHPYFVPFKAATVAAAPLAQYRGSSRISNSADACVAF